MTAPAERAAGPYDRPRRVPRRNVWHPDAVDDGARTTVNPTTGEITTTPPSPGRAARLHARAAGHRARQQQARVQRGQRAREWGQAIRERLPARTPPGLQRPSGQEWRL